MTGAAASTSTQAVHLNDAFTGAIAPVKVTPLYRLGLLLVALTMIVLPLVYVGLVAAFGREEFRDRSPDTIARAGYDGDFSVQPHGLPPRSLDLPAGG